MLHSFLIANPKGGCGKTTLATNLAGYFARQGHRVMLGDIDRQQSSREWLKLRPQGLPPIRSWDIAPGEPARPPKDTSHVVLDTPAGLHGKKLDVVVKSIHRVIVPLQPSIFDILATRDFLDVPVLGFLRDTQTYVQAAAHGLTLFDLSPARAEKDLPQWQGIIDWVESPHE